MESLTADVEIYLCERYQPLKGWSASNLLLTDRRTVRLKGCHQTWDAASDTEAYLLAPGWSWVESDDASWLENPTDDVGPDGWTYATNFNSLFEGTPYPGVLSLVRWKRLSRRASFGGVHELARALGRQDVSGCFNVDMEAAQKTSQVLLEGLAEASLRSEWSILGIAKLKRRLLVWLRQRQKGSVKTLKQSLSDFVTEEAGMFSIVSDVLQPLDENQLRLRVEEMRDVFPEPEREAYVTLIIRLLSPEHSCSAGSEDHDCSFRPDSCPNAGCSVRMSHYALQIHDQGCMYKVVPCSKCSELVSRSDMSLHLVETCAERDVICEFAAIGCSDSVSVRGLPGHSAACTVQHISLLLKTILAQQESLGALQERVNELETTLLERTNELDKRAVDMSTQVENISVESTASNEAVQIKLQQISDQLRQVLGTSTDNISDKDEKNDACDEQIDVSPSDTIPQPLEASENRNPTASPTSLEVDSPSTAKVPGQSTPAKAPTRQTLTETPKSKINLALALSAASSPRKQTTSPASAPKKIVVLSPVKRST